MKYFNTLIFFILGIVSFQSCQQSQHKTSLKNIETYKGFNFTGTPYEMTDFSSFDSLSAIGVNWVSFSPYHYMSNTSSASIIDSFPRQWHSESTTGIIQQTKAAHAHNLKTMIKPHIWIMDGGFTGDIEYKSDKEWRQWQDDYTRYLITFAHICQSSNADLLCIGNELKSAIHHNPKYWNTLIDSIRTIYKGKLTYAANWDNFEQIPFWDKLDVVGVNAYFPLSNDQNPSEESIKKGWGPWLKKIQKLKEKVSKPIVFTEMGYRATSYCCKAPWDYSKTLETQETCQEVALHTFFDHVFAKEIEGVFLWKYFDHNDNYINRDLYSPQHRVSWKIVCKYFMKW